MKSTSGGRARALTGALWGTALGDALGLPYEGLSEAAVRERSGALNRYRLFGERGFVSDDTEQSALVLESLLRGGDDVASTVRSFRRALLGWFLRLPFGIGLATLRACLRLLFGWRESGVRSASNGAAMRAGLIGVFFAHDAARRRAHTAALARVTHTDPRAVEGSLYCAELAALCVREPHGDRAELALRALRIVRNRELHEALEGAVLMARSRHATSPLYNTGYVVHTLALCTWAFVRAGDSPLAGIQAAIRAGGDTDTAAAIVGCWLGTMHGPEALPNALLEKLADGPFGVHHLAALAQAADGQPLPAWSATHALLRNLMLYPVVLGHALLRLLRGHAFASASRGSALAKALRS